MQPTNPYEPSQYPTEEPPIVADLKGEEMPIWLAVLFSFLFVSPLIVCKYLEEQGIIPTEDEIIRRLRDYLFNS